MTIDTTTPRSRRALLTAAVGGVAAAAVTTAARVNPVAAADGGNVIIGQDNVSTTRTQVTKTSAGSVAFIGSGKPNAVGLWGLSTNHIGVLAQSANHTGLEAKSDSGLGLHVSSGRIRVSEVSGVATIRKGNKSVAVIPGVPINTKTFVLLTPMSNIGSRGIWFTRHPSTNRFVIHMSSTRGAPTKVAWLALERG